jgi:hypothetical protein
MQESSDFKILLRGPSSMLLPRGGVARMTSLGPNEHVSPLLRRPEIARQVAQQNGEIVV